MGEDDHPKLFSNHVISQLVRHVLGEDTTMQYEDYMSMRVAFRHKGGSWIAMADGDLAQVDTLKDIVSAWGKMPGRKEESGRVI